jgi:hypothetical protein
MVEDMLRRSSLASGTRLQTTWHREAYRELHSHSDVPRVPSDSSTGQAKPELNLGWASVAVFIALSVVTRNDTGEVLDLVG